MTLTIDDIPAGWLLLTCEVCHRMLPEGSFTEDENYEDCTICHDCHKRELFLQARRSAPTCCSATPARACWPWSTSVRPRKATVPAAAIPIPPLKKFPTMKTFTTSSAGTVDDDK